MICLVRVKTKHHEVNQLHLNNMALKTYRPTSNGRRHMTGIDYKVLTTTKPYKPLTKHLPTRAGRNNSGRITVRHQGGGHKRRYRIIDFKRNKDNIAGRIASIEYDPYRNAFISLVNYCDGEKRYILHCQGLKVGMSIISGDKIPFHRGNTTQLQNIPDGLVVHNIELNPGQGGKLARSAGTSARLIAKSDDHKYVTLQLSSGEVRKVLGVCRATIGTVSNEDYNLIT